MAEDKSAMPADCSGTERKMPDENGELASRRDGDAGGTPNAGESGGGAYPNPHSGKDGSDGYKGGQSGGSGYYGSGQLGDKDVGETHNAPAERDED